ncbi:MAG TPA: zinc ribbon domain-containing protein [Streptosporangiaceae bacterium]|nr:zinc ribbon domain-containing protein [Streptosporangiaceae bacterium]
MIGTRAHRRSRVYRYYTCFTRIRYDTARCPASRLDADAVEDAVIAALASFYRDQHDLIAAAIAAAQASRAAGHQDRRAELAAAEHELARTAAAIDRYLDAFEQGTLDPEDLDGRLAQLKPAQHNCAPAARNTPLTSPQRPPRRQRPPSGRSQSTSKTSSAQAPATSARPSSKPSSPESRSSGRTGSSPYSPHRSREDANRAVPPTAERDPQASDAVHALTNLAGGPNTPL